MSARRSRRVQRVSRARAPTLPGGSAAAFFALALIGSPSPGFALPPGFELSAVPADEPLTSERVALGRALFTDPRLSFNGTVSCASCHDPAHSFSDPRPASVGAAGQTLTLNAPSLVNAGYRAAYGWAPNGAVSLTEQIRRPFTQLAPIELATQESLPAIVARLDGDAAVRTAFAAAFGAPGRTESAAPPPSPVTFDRVVAALAAYVRTLVGGRSAFDRYVFAGEHSALTPEQKLGFTLFYSPRLGCGTCHGGLLFDGPWVDARNPQAAAAVAPSVTGDGVFRVPSLRNAARTAPYLHDGRDATLGEVVARYDLARNLALTTDERAALLAFLAALTDAPAGAE